MLTPEAIWRLLEEVKDPEIPVVSLVEMGIVRDVAVTDGRVMVTITPTFSGCPALHVMQEQIRDRLESAGAETVAVQVALWPPWTTDSITGPGREKLRQFGLAPPAIHAGNIEILLREEAECPTCGSSDTSMRNNWGPTPCRAIYYCHSCQQPFEQFKPL